MGVHGLWELLAPVGRRVSVDTLGSRKLAIDASIWIIQFMKAMRDDKGDMIRNAHLLGFFRRICKLLFLRIKPVFVFDGATPALKRRTVIARRRQRENAQSKIRKTAEKLLLNHMRTRKLEEIAADISLHPPSSKSEKVGLESPAAVGVTPRQESEANEQVDFDPSSRTTKYDQVQADAELAASLTRDYGESHRRVDESDEDDDDAEEELILPPAKGFDPSVLASLPPSMQLDLLHQMREQLVAENRQRFQNVAKVPSSFSQMQIQAYLKTVAFRREINEVQKAAAGGGIGGVPTARVASTTDREFIFSKSFEGEKPAPSEVEEQTRVEQTPSKRANPVNLPKSLIKPSSMLFSALTNRQENAAPEDGVVSLVSTQLNEDSTPSSNSMVHTYIDERGYVRVNRRRGMGVRMTRDLQWNLYLMKDSEARNAEGKLSASTPPVIPSSVTVDNAVSASIPVPPSSTSGREIEISFLDDGGLEGGKDEDGDLFEELISEGGDASNNLGSCVVNPSLEANNNRGLVNSDGVMNGGDEVEEDQVEWEDGGIHENGFGSVVEDQDLAEAMRLSLLGHGPAPTAGSGEYGDQILLEDGPSSEESEVEWEDGTGDVSAADLDGVSKEEHSRETLISGEEEAQIEEAIRRSLEDFGPSLKPLSQLIIKEPVAIESRNREMEGLDASSATRGFTVQIQDDTSVMRGESESEEVFLARERTRKGKAVLSGDDGRIKFAADEPAAPVISEQARVVSEMPVIEPTSLLPPTGRPFQGALDGLEIGNQDDDTGLKHVLTEGAAGLATNENPVLPIGSETKQNVAAQPPSTVVERPDKESSNAEVPKLDEGSAGRHEMEKKKDSLLTLPSEGLQDPRGRHLPPDPIINHVEVEWPRTSGEVKSNNGPYTPQKKVAKSDEDDLIREAEEFDIEAEREQQQSNERAIAAEMERLAREEANLQEELEMEQEEIRAGIERERELLEKEQSELRTQQKKFERNAESVTGEMFAEVQELLQMFGLPYLIAPMEAEAQCAFMDIVQLVDGVVTDDSDAFLFGGRTVYKNLFDDRKYVETYYMKDLESEMGMTREKLIRIAMLLGSDYTEGISGIGIVNAIEVVNAFPEKEGLQKFKEWLDSPDHTLFEKERGRSSGKTKGSTKDPALDGTGDDMEGSDDSEFTVTQRLFMGKHRAVSKNWNIPESFPSEAVVNAYVSPTVDKSKEAFSWGRPDLEALRQ